MRSARRYLLFQLPGLILFTVAVVVAHGVFDLPSWVFPAAAGFWIAKEVALYPLIRRSLVRRDRVVDRLVGATAVVTKTLEPEGWVRAGGELWRARSSSGSSIAPGIEVRIIEIDRMTLIVEVSARPLA